MSRGIGIEELRTILTNNPRMIGPIRGMAMAGFLSKEELEGLVTGSVGTTDLADDAVTAPKVKDGEIGTAELAPGAVTKAKIGYKVVAVTVAAGGTSGSSAADTELVGGEIIGLLPSGNQDQLVDNIVLGTDGSVTITLGAAATADNTFNVIVAKP